MKEPIRLRLDPEQPAGLRSALDAEIAAPLAHDLIALKQGLGAHIASGASPASGALSALKGVAVMLALGTVAAWWWSQPEPARLTEAPRPEAAVRAPVRIAQTAPAVASEQTASADEAAATQLAVNPVPAPHNQPARPNPKAASIPVARHDQGDPAPAPERPQAPGSSLAAQMALYAEAQTALEAQQWAKAEAGFAEYLGAYADGSLVTEATLGRLEALHQAGRFAEVSRSAQAILNDGRLAGRHAEIQRVLAEAEVMQGHCAQAKTAYQRARALGASVSDDDVHGAVQACEGGAMR